MENKNIFKKEDEIYCPECGKAIKRNAVVCIYCGVQVRTLMVEHIKNKNAPISLKSKENQKTNSLNEIGLFL